MNDNSRYIPWIVVGVTAFILVIMMLPPGERSDLMNLYEFGTLPVVDGGRTKPFDTFARTTLFAISDRQTFVDEEGNTQPAVRWALDVMSDRVDPTTKSPAWVDYQVFYISSDQVLHTLHLKERSGLRYSLREIKTGVMREDETTEQSHGDGIQLLVAEAAKAEDREASQRDRYEVKVIELARNVDKFIKIQRHLTPLMVPGQTNEDWVSFGDALLEDGKPDPNRPTARYLNATLNAYSAGQPEAFNKLVSAYKEQLAGAVPETVESHNSWEVFFNHFGPFYVCSVLYVFVFLIACASWTGIDMSIPSIPLVVSPIWRVLRLTRWIGSWIGREPLRQSAFWLAVLALIVHTWALFARMYLLERPLVFVTNLYSSAIFIGWGAVGLGLVLERLYRNTVGIVVAAVAGSLTLLVAHNIATGDTLEMMQAVLDTNFWLATHVTCVTIGYMATFVSGFLGLAYIIRGVFTSTLDWEAVKTLGQMMYGIICFAMMFSFIGTVLGGIWADQSWGRFWGWDPKENGALLIVIWNALILHARWGGMVKQRGMAVLAVAGNIVTSWSWFGTNMLGVGLHSYGFMQGAVFWLLAWVTLNLVIIGIGTLPLRMWTSFAAAPKREDVLPPSTGAGKKFKKEKGEATAIQPA